MGRSYLNLIFVTLIFVLVSSCSKNEDALYSLDNFWITMGIIETDNSLGSNYVIFCDNGDTLVPITNKDASSFSDSQRVIVNYTILNNVENSDQKFYVNINNLQNVLFKDLIELTSTNSDSLGNDPLVLTDMWITNNILNIEFNYTGGNLTHYINLAYSNSEKNDINQPVELFLRHNARNDSETYNLHSIVSFNLNKLNKDGRSKIDFTIKSLDYYNEEHSSYGTYKY